MKKQASIKALACDLDGTLVDSLPGLTQAICLSLDELSLPRVTQDQVNKWIGNGADIMIQRVLTAIKAPLTLQSDVRKRFDPYYLETVNNGTILYPNVYSTLETLHQQNYRLAIVTNKPSQFVPNLLNSLNIAHFFSLVLGGDDVVKQKPHPAPLYQVLASFGLYAQELLFVGDSRNDILAAQQANCPVVGVNYGYNYGEPIASSNPSYIFDDFKEILTILN